MKKRDNIQELSRFYLFREDAANMLKKQNDWASKITFDFACNIVAQWEQDSTLEEIHTAYNQRYGIHKS